MDDGVTRLEGPVELFEGELVLAIPLEMGGAAFIESTRKIGRVMGDMLVVTIPAWLAGKLGIVAGSVVAVDNAGGKFNLRLAAPEAE